MIFNSSTQFDIRVKIFWVTESKKRILAVFWHQFFAVFCGIESKKRILAVFWVQFSTAFWFIKSKKRFLAVFWVQFSAAFCGIESKKRFLAVFWASFFDRIWHFDQIRALCASGIIFGKIERLEMLFLGFGPESSPHYSHLTFRSASYNGELLGFAYMRRAS